MMTHPNTLPQQIHAWSGERGRQLENVRRMLLDLLFKYDFQYVHPPILEYQQTLSLGSGKLSQDRAFRFVDPLSGKMLAVRTDISPQISRIDYSLNVDSNVVAKYCYAGEIALATVDCLAIRNPYQVGGEIFGDSSVKADIEAINIAIECCRLVDQADLLIDLGHTGILKKAICKLSLEKSQEIELLAILQCKSVTDGQKFIDKYGLNTDQKNIISFLFHCSQISGSQQSDYLQDQVYKILPECRQKWQHLSDIFGHIKQQFPTIKQHIDLAELRGYSYHTGIVFGIYSNKKLICRGGRYNHCSSAQFRTATGFTLDVNSLALP